MILILLLEDPPDLIYALPASVSWGLREAEGQDPLNLRHSWHQSSQDEPTKPQWCTEPTFFICLAKHFILFRSRLSFFLVLALLQREIHQQQRPADLHAHDTGTHALLPRQWDHQRCKLRTQERCFWQNSVKGVIKCWLNWIFSVLLAKI